MPRVDRDLVIRLGRELVARGLSRQADAVRLYLIALDRGLLDVKHTLSAHVTPDFLIDWCGLLQLPPHETRFELFNDGIGCPRCGADAVTYVEVSVLDRTRRRCTSCGTRWITIAR